jgi:hypothetical protein
LTIRHRAKWSILLLALATGTANAEPSPDDVKNADRLFLEAQKLLKAGNLSEACASFAESERLDPALGTLLNLADCHAQEHRTATARAEFIEAAQVAAKAGKRERETFARNQLKELDAILSYVAVRIPSGAGIDEARIDGGKIDAVVLASPIPLDPGMHTFQFSGALRKPRRVTLEVSRGPSTQVLEVAPLEAVKEPEPSGVAADTHVKERKEPIPRRTLALVAGGLGVVGIGFGTYFGLTAASKKSDGDAHCAGRFCDAEGLALHDDSHSAALASTIAFGVGLVSLGVGAYLWFTAPHAKGMALAFSPTLGGARVGAHW